MDYEYKKLKKWHILVLIVIILSLMHLWKYNSSADTLSIDVQDLDNVSNLHTYLNPTVIRFIELDTLAYNATTYHLYDPLSIINKSRLFNINRLFQPESTSGIVYRSYHSVMLVRPYADCIVRLYPPQYSRFFKSTTLSSQEHNSQTDENDDYVPSHAYSCAQSENEVLASGLRIKLYDYTILYIPRRWFYQIDAQSKRVQVYTSDTLVSLWVNFIGI
jgi:hypothetical protein